MSSPLIYTVGWICAITVESVAAQSFLDEKHPPLSAIDQNDGNIYVLGKFGGHNVAIAALPDGEYGTASAAMVARDMLRTFPNIRFGLMVGIGGGAPTADRDIRLGDVVVSSRGSNDGSTGGVFQYDYGKTIQNRSFHFTGFLNQPPALLRAAVSALKAQHELDGHCLNEDIVEALQKIKMRQKYSQPPPARDKLFKAEIVHPHLQDGPCSRLCGGEDTDNLVDRNDREPEDNIPAIHYGVIASGNSLMKDAYVRDKLAAEKHILCFEMEASGLMNHFPCLVVRGICDYSDSHKSKDWQGYAAMAAAAYAKSLLSQIPPSKIETERPAIEAIRHC
jgi:nucleoside phosphorylase